VPPGEGHPMTFEVALLRDIMDNPGDDTPRLVLADWLQDQPEAAQAARGEFIRGQLLLDDLPPGDPRRGELVRRPPRLQEDREDDGLGPLARLARDWAFHGGLVWLEVAGSRLFAAEDTPALASLLWVDGLRWLDASARLVARLADWPHLPNLVTLDL